MTSSGEREQRLGIITEAQKWIGTPYVAAQGVMGVGVDCAMLLLKVYETCGVSAGATLPVYQGPLARLHAGERMYVKMIEKFCHRVEREADAGDIVVFKVPVGRRLGHTMHRRTHGAIVLGWPRIIHACVDAGRVVVTDLHCSIYKSYLDRTYTLKGWV